MDTDYLPRDRHLNISKGVVLNDEQDKLSPPVTKLIATAAFCGIVHGFVAEKCRVYDPSVIQEQMLFHRFLLMKVIFSTASTGMFCLSILSMVPASSEVFQRFRLRFLLQGQNKGAVWSIVGTMMLGVGMGISGMTPSLVVVQLGVRVETAVYGLAGCLVGALLFGLVASFGHTSMSSAKNVQHFHCDHRADPYFTHALPGAALLSSAVFALELWTPWDAELADDDLSAWPPYVSGILMGLLLIPQILILQQTLDGSSGFCTMGSQVLVTKKAQRKLSQLSRHRSGLANWLQVVFLGCCALGALISSSISSNRIVPMDVSHSSSFIGGVLVMVGAQLASGNMFMMLIQSILL